MFYIIERSDQLQQLKSFDDCFISFIPKNNNYHPSLTSLSLIYIRPIDGKKGYMLCLDHNESFSLNQIEVINWLHTNTGKLFLLDKKEALHWVYSLSEKLFDINFIEPINLTELNNNCINYYYTSYTNLPNINCLIPISKHYEECEATFNVSLPTIKKYTLTNTQFQFQNFRTTDIFYEIEKNGIKLDKDCFINYYKGKLQYPEFNLSKSRIYSQYNLYNTTSRPSNTYNSINFVALNKDDGERNCYKPENDKFIEIDFQGYHPRLIGEMIGFEFPKDRNTYELLGELLGVSQQEAKELTFKQLYGGVWSEYQNKPFFKEVAMYIDDMWDTYQYGGHITTENKIFIRDGLDKMTPHKLLNYVIQSKETSTNVKLLELALNYLKDKKTKIVLYTYDSILLDYAFSDGDQMLIDIKNILYYPVNIKIGKNYHTLEKI